VSRPKLRQVAGIAVTGVVVLAVVVLPPLVTALLPPIPLWLAATFLGGVLLVIITISAVSPDNGSSHDDSEA
jgi:hypothetical protein